jgi:adenosylcobinamide-GDP ribazoletransferase
MKKEIQIVLTAFLFYTRINISRFVIYEEENLSKCTKYLPVVGWLVGGFSALVYTLCIQALSPAVAVILSILISVLITGAFHEDGLADSCDGFGGGWTKDRILTIMKDSRIGTYGTVSLIILFGLKIALLIDVYVLLNDSIYIILFTISAHSVSRYVASTFIYTHKYTRDNVTSKVKPVAENSNVLMLIVGGVLAFIPFLILAYLTANYLLLLAIIPMYVSKLFLGRFFNKWIDGYTGDTLGATQQITELVFYISILILWKFTL